MALHTVWPILSLLEGPHGEYLQTEAAAEVFRVPFLTHRSQDPTSHLLLAGKAGARVALTGVVVMLAVRLAVVLQVVAILEGLAAILKKWLIDGRTDTHIRI